MFASSQIRKGTLLAVFGGHVMRGEQEPTFPDGRADLAIQVHDDFVLGPLFPDELEPADAFNHSCSPNAGLKGQILLVAMCDIGSGTQVCFDYAMCLNTPGYHFVCHCGAPTCRGVVTGEDWKLGELQRRYRGYFSTYLQEKIDALSEGGKTRHWGMRFAELATGFCSNAALNFAFDWLLYPFVIFRFGVLWGGLAMSLTSFAACIALLWLYDLLKRDWLGIEAVKALRDNPGNHIFRRFLSRILRWGDGPAFVLLSLHFDPFITVAYLRRGRFDGMRKREWIIFIGSWALSNGWWIIACYLGVSLLVKVGQLLASG